MEGRLPPGGIPPGSYTTRTLAAVSPLARAYLRDNPDAKDIVADPETHVPVSIPRVDLKRTRLVSVRIPEAALRRAARIEPSALVKRLKNLRSRT